MGDKENLCLGCNVMLSVSSRGSALDPRLMKTYSSSAQISSDLHPKVTARANTHTNAQTHVQMYIFSYNSQRAINLHTECFSKLWDDGSCGYLEITVIFCQSLWFLWVVISVANGIV